MPLIVLDWPDSDERDRLALRWRAGGRYNQFEEEELVSQDKEPHLLVGLLIALVALVAAGCGGSDGGGAPEALPSSSCTAIEYEGDGDPDYLIVSDLPLQGASRTQTVQMVDAIRYVLKQADFKAGDYKIGYQSCDDATAQAGKWDSGKCSANANAYAANDKLLGVIGTFNSGCAAIIIPVLNQAPDGGIAMISPANTLVCLTQASLACDKTEPDKYYPSGTRNYARVVAHDAYQGAANAEFAQAIGIKNVFILNDKEPYGLGVATNFRNAAESLGIKIAGFDGVRPEGVLVRGALQEDPGHGRRRRLHRRPDRRERRPADQGQGRGARAERRRRQADDTGRLLHCRGRSTVPALLRRTCTRRSPASRSRRSRARRRSSPTSSRTEYLSGKTPTRTRSMPPRRPRSCSRRSPPPTHHAAT